MAVTRLGQLGIGVDAYGVFEAKTSAPVVAALSEPSFAITQAFLDRLAEEWTDTAVVGLNGVTVVSSDGGPFIVVEHHEGQEFKPSATTRRVLKDGRIELRLHVQSGTGLTTGLELADDLATLFRETEFDGVRTFTPSPPLIGDFNDEGNWLALRVLVPYRYQFDG